jgi:competence protein ComEC
MFHFNLFIILFSVILFSITSPAISSHQVQPLRITILDVKQGDAILIISPSGKTILIDGADRTAQYKDSDGNTNTFYPAFDSIIPYLKRNNITKIDQIIISHPHADHIGGLADLINNINIAEITDSYEYSTNMYKELKILANKKNIKWSKVYRGDIIDFGGDVKATVMHPPKNFHLDISKYGLDKHKSSRGNLNNVSIVLRVQYKDLRYLLTGDAEKEAEIEMFTFWNDFKTTVLKCAHHGSKTSSSPGFLEKCDPKFAFISVGEINKFSHPDKKITLPNIEYYTTKNNGGMYRTDKKGTIETWTFGEKIHIACEKGENAFISLPQNTIVLNDSAIIEWTTSNPSSTEITINGKTFSIPELTNKHIITVTGLQPGNTYDYTVISKETSQGKPISAKNRLITISENTNGAKIKSIKMIPNLPYFGERVTLSANILNFDPSLKIVFYKDTIESTRELISKKITSSTITAKWTTNFTGRFKLFAALYKGSKLISIFDSNAIIATKKAMIDNYHWNSGTYKNNMSNFKLDLIKNGFEVYDNSKPFTEASLKNIDLLVITDPKKPNQSYSLQKKDAPDFKESEINALNNYVNSGKGLLLASQNDYIGNIDSCNRILETLKAKIRFNDDTVIDKTHIGWERTIQCSDINTKIVSSQIKGVLCSNSCSLVSADKKPFNSISGVFVTTRGNTNFANIDTDSNNDAIIYPKNINIPISAVQILPSGGRIAVFGSSYQLSNSVYTHSTSHQTDRFNLEIAQWLSSFDKKDLNNIFVKIQKEKESYISSEVSENSTMENEYENVILDNFMNCLESEDFDEANNIFKSLQILPAEKIKWLKPSIKKMLTAITYVKMQNDSSPKWNVLYNNLIDLLEND